MNDENHDLYGCDDPDCQICNHGDPPLCGCVNLSIYCGCCEEEYVIPCISYKPDQGCRYCGCGVEVIHEEVKIQ